MKTDQNEKQTDIAQKYYAQTKESQASSKKLETFSMWSFLISIFPISFFWLFLIPFVNIIFSFFIFPLLITSIVFGVIGLKNITKNNKIYYGRGFAIAGIIISILLILILALIAIIALKIIFKLI